MRWHPVLFALAPVIALASANIEGLPGRYILRPALLTTASAAVFSTLLGFRLRNGHQAALLGSLTCVFFL